MSEILEQDTKEYIIKHQQAYSEWKNNDLNIYFYWDNVVFYSISNRYIPFIDEKKWRKEVSCVPTVETTTELYRYLLAPSLSLPIYMYVFPISNGMDTKDNPIEFLKRNRDIKRNFLDDIVRIATILWIM